MQPGSGSSQFYKGDVRKQGDVRIECKTTGSRSYVLKLTTLEKIKAEAIQGGELEWALQVEYQTISGNKKFAVVDWAAYINMRNELIRLATQQGPVSMGTGHFVEPHKPFCLNCGAELNSFGICPTPGCE